MEEKIKELLIFYQDKYDYFSKNVDEYIKENGNDNNDFLNYQKNQKYLFIGAIQALKRLL